MSVPSGALYRQRYPRPGSATQDTSPTPAKPLNIRAIALSRRPLSVVVPLLHGRDRWRVGCVRGVDATTPQLRPSPHVEYCARWPRCKSRCQASAFCAHVPVGRAERAHAWDTPAAASAQRNRWACLRATSQRRLQGFVSRRKERAEHQSRPFHQYQNAPLRAAQRWVSA